MKFPALVISKVMIDKINYRHFVSNNKYINIAYKNVIIVDSAGDFFKINGIQKSGGISIIDTLINFNLLVKVIPILEEPVKKITLDKFRDIILINVNKNSYNFSSLFDKKSLIAEIKSRTNFTEIINIF